ncbi:MAG: hypothetical protein CBB68_09990 [Rhodospirillaceae bacterium TMED8]|nr:hypothetical protein [Magnetovibrio sp.]OUT50185.1 MAG: hypothetical protein CBB68_09990 [Rhodospirillaceae bacterium TMED8]|tara:strand:- start:3718 stop:4437 length:720 start_codon:yes stop_codon:yes gene_type:complete
MSSFQDQSSPQPGGHRQHQAELDGDEGDDRQHTAAIDADGLPLDAISPEAQRIIDSLAAQIEPMRLEVAQARARENRLYELARIHSVLPIPDRREFERELRYIIDHILDAGALAKLLVINIESAEVLRRSLGWACSNAMILHAVRVIKGMSENNDILGSLCGHDLGVILFSTDLKSLETKIKGIERHLNETPLNWQGENIAIRPRLGSILLDAGCAEMQLTNAVDKVFCQTTLPNECIK